MSNFRVLTTEEAVAWVLDPRNDNGETNAIYVMAANYDPNGKKGEWDGLMPEDVETATEGDMVDLVFFAEWGPFRLVWEGADPGEPRDFTPEEAVERIASFLGVFEHHSPSLDHAIAALDDFVRRVREEGAESLTWGEPGECDARVDDDTDENDGRHFGVPHCIWCLQAQ